MKWRGEWSRDIGILRSDKIVTHIELDIWAKNKWVVGYSEPSNGDLSSPDWAKNALFLFGTDNGW